MAVDSLHSLWRRADVLDVLIDEQVIETGCQTVEVEKQVTHHVHGYWYT